ncbi:Kinesin-like protein KIF18A [Lucilia cuprina]|nr:Kinesin-like protein KIF18A [Lucilia cuprina]
MTTEQKNIKVVVRVRPYNRRELEQNQRTIIKVMDQTTLLFDPDEDEDEFFFQGVKQNHRDITKKVNKKLSMEYDRVYDTDTTNMQIFEECTAPLVDSVLNGYNCSVFVYGATGAGKTFTMLGSATSPGLTFLTMRDLFDKIEAQSDVRKFDVGVSYLEVYNEQVMNLLTKTGPLKLREDSNGVVVSGLALKPIYSAEELLELLALGNSNRTQHPTDANAESSRSHAVFQVHIRITDRKTGTKRMVKLSMIDLAGSERAASTKGIGIRFKEGASINKSLLALGNCINKLADGLKHIPYRDSNLTRILKDSLGGNCQTLMVANVSMSSLTYEDTYNTLKYASRAKKIRTTLRQNALKTNMPKEFYVKKVNELMDENERLKQTNSALEAKANKATTFDESELKPWYSRIDQIYASIIKTQEQYISIKSRVKNLTFRIKLKTDMENSRKIIYGDCESKENCTSYTSSVCHLSSKIDKLKAEFECWRQKLRSVYKNLDYIKTEIKSSKYASFLQIYLKYKNSEVQNSKISLINKHITAIDLELCAKATWLETTFKLASHIIKNGNLNTQQMCHYELLKRHLSNTNFSNDVDNDVEAENSIDSSKQPASSDEDVDHQHMRSCRKRLRLDEYDLDDTDDINGSSADDAIDDDVDMDDMHTTFKMPAKRPRNPNETHVLSEMDTNGDNTFYMGPSKTSTLTVGTKFNAKIGKDLTLVKTNIVSNMLSDKMVKATCNTEQLKNVLLKSKKFSHATLRTVAGGLQKENKKFSPNRIRKSPRTVISKAASMQINQHQISRIANDAAAPVVRLNRAASFRTKK